MQWIYAVVLMFCLIVPGFAQTQGLVIDSFEGPITGGPDGTVNFGAGNGSSVNVSASKSIKFSGEHALKIVYDAVPGGYIFVAKGSGLAAKNAGWIAQPTEADWAKYNALSFYMYGSDNGAWIAFDIKDKGNEAWRFLLKDDFTGWKQIICPFLNFFVRRDWQPENADRNGIINFPLKSYQFEPQPDATGIFYIDDVALVNK